MQSPSDQDNCPDVSVWLPVQLLSPSIGGDNVACWSDVFSAIVNSRHL